MFIFIGNYQSGCIILHSQNQCMRVPVILHPYQHLTSVVHFIYFLSHSTRYVVMSHCHFSLQFLMTNCLEHLFMYLFAICILFLVKCLSMSFVHVLIGLFAFHFWVVIILHVFWILVLCWVWGLQILLPLGSMSCLPHESLSLNKSFKILTESSLWVFLLCIVFLV